MTISDSTGVLIRLAEVREECKELFRKANDWLALHGHARIESDVDDPIKLVLCGTYNAGKSTIVNALLGEKKAATGDFPETKKPHNYDWRGYHIVDLPGYDAREMESDVARKAVQVADAVLYVVSSQSGLDHESTWKDIQGLSSDKIPFLVVINDKKPYQDEDTEKKSRESIQQNFFSKAYEKIGDKGLSTVHWVRANRAEKGRTEEKLELTRKSGIEQLEADILGKLEACNVIIRLRKQVSEFVRGLIIVRDKLTENMNNSAEYKVAELLKMCSVARESLQNKVQLISLSEFNDLKELIISTREGQVFGVKSEGNLSDQINSTYSQALTTFESFAKERARLIYAQLSKDMSDAGISVDSLNVEFSHINGMSEGDNSGEDMISDGLKAALKAWAKEWTKESTEEAVKQTVKSAAKEGGKQAAKQAAKQAGKETVKEAGKEALKEGGKATVKQGGKEALKEAMKKWIGPAIEIIDCIDTMRKGWAQASKEKKKEEAALRQINAHSNLVVNRIKQQFASACKNYSNNLLEPIENGIKEQVDNQKRNNEDLMKQYTYGNDLILSLERQSAQLFAWAQNDI